MLDFTDEECAALPVPPQVFAQFIACLLGKRYVNGELGEYRESNGEEV